MNMTRSKYDRILTYAVFHVTDTYVSVTARSWEGGEDLALQMLAQRIARDYGPEALDEFDQDTVSVWQCDTVRCPEGVPKDLKLERMVRN